MIEETRNWACVNVDSYIIDGRGEAWRIAAIDETEASEGTTGAFLAFNRAGDNTTITPKPLEGPVKMLVPEPEEDVEHLVELLRDKLGARRLGTIDSATKTVSCQPWPVDKAPSPNLTPWKDHLEAFHLMYAGDIKGFAKLVEAHEAAHDEEIRVGKYIPHTHDLII